MNGSSPAEGNFQNWTEISVHIKKTDEILQNWRDDTKVGLIAFTAVAIPLIVILSFIPCLYHTFLKIKGTPAASKPAQDLDLSGDEPALSAVRHSEMDTSGYQPVNNIN